MMEPRIPAATIFTAAAAFLGGGFAGSVFTWYVNRPEPTVITYTVGTTTVAAPEASLTPNLRILLGDAPVKSLFAHNVELSAAAGKHIDRVEVALTFPVNTTIYATTAAAPSEVHTLTCSRSGSGVRCALSPIAPGDPGPYRIGFATDQKQPPTIVTATKDVTLMSGSDFLALQSGTLRYKLTAAFAAEPARFVFRMLGIVTYLVLLPIIYRRLRSRS
jgi:hypothetical protein